MGVGLSGTGINNGGIYSTIKGLASAHNPTIPQTQENASLGYRPPMWGSSSSDPTGSQARYCLVYQDILTNNSTNEGSGNTGQLDSEGNPIFALNAVAQPTSVYNVFDAILTGRFNSSLNITDYPVQSGQVFSYNAVLMPMRITLEIGMSDAMQSYIPTNFTGNNSRSVAAKQLLDYLQTNRVFCTLNTRWGNYPNMLIEDLSLEDNNQTYASARFSVTFRQVQVANVATITYTARPNTTQQVNGGTCNSASVPSQTVTTNQIQQSDNTNGYATVDSMTDNGNQQPVNAGNYSSNPVATLSNGGS